MLLQKKTGISLQSLSKPGKFKMTAAQAWKEGTTIQTALRYDGERTRSEIVRMITNVVDFIDAKRTLRSVEDKLLCAETLLDDFPAIRLEEFRIACDRMKQGYFGDYFERLQIKEFREALISIEEERAGMMEKEHRNADHQITRGAQDPTKIPEYDPEKARLEWMLSRNPFLIPGKNRKETEDRENSQDLSDIEKDES